MSIELRNVSYTYSAGTPFETAALYNVDLKINDGEFVGIMGRTGCGKSTLIQLMAGLVEPASGDILLDGKNISGKGYDRGELRQKVGVVFQYPEYQLFETTVEKDVAFGLKWLDLSKAEKRERVRSALELTGFDFDEVKDKSPLGLSGGEKRRVAIAGVLAVQPKILILDEPIAGLDPLSREDFLDLLHKLNRKGTTIIMVSHNADAICKYAKRLLIIEDGKIIRDGRTRDVFSDAEGMIEHGLGVSQSREAAYLLKQRGIDFPQDIINYEELIYHLEKLGKEMLKHE